MAAAVEITIASHPRWLRLIRRLVQEFALEAGFDRQDSHGVTLAVCEAVGNVLKHSYQGDTGRSVTLSLGAETDGVEIGIRDSGDAFDPNGKEILPPDELRAGGRGLFLIRTIMDEVEYAREGGCNVMRMRKRISAPVAKTS